MIEIKGFERMITKIQHEEIKWKQAAEFALESVCREMVNYIKNSTAWKDHTTNLRNSIGFVPSESQFEIIPASKSKLPLSMPMQVGWVGDSLQAVIFAGMEYAISVEFKDGHWVLGGAFVEYHGKWLNLIEKRMKDYIG